METADLHYKYTSSSTGLSELSSLNDRVRRHFPIFQSHPELAYLDTAASAQKLSSVLEQTTRFMAQEYANIHRGAYALSAQATEAFYRARQVVARFLGVDDCDTVVFTRGATESINLVAHSFGSLLKAGDTVLLSALEHHSNIVPWHLLSKRMGINIQFVPVGEHATIDTNSFCEKIHALRPALVGVTGLSNAFGTMPDLAEIIRQSHDVSAKVLVDGAQMVVHGDSDLSTLDPDFFVFSGHKLYASTGIGVLYGKRELLEQMPPFLGGGDMIERVTFQDSTFAPIPKRFEAGTPAIVEAIGLAAALEQLEEIGWPLIQRLEKELFAYGVQQLQALPGVRIVGPVAQGGRQQSIISFLVDGVHPHDIATIADSFGVQLRAGHHCAMPAMHQLQLPATCRASIGCYTRAKDFDLLVEAIEKAKSLFS